MPVLTSDVVGVVLARLGCTDLATAACICRAWRRQADAQALWEQHLALEFGIQFAGGGQLPGLSCAREALRALKVGAERSTRGRALRAGLSACFLGLNGWGRCPGLPAWRAHGIDSGVLAWRAPAAALPVPHPCSSPPHPLHSFSLLSPIVRPHRPAPPWRICAHALSFAPRSPIFMRGGSGLCGSTSRQAFRG